MALAMSLLLVRAGIRFLLPILLVLYVLPFVGAPEVVARTITRLGRAAAVVARATSSTERPAHPARRRHRIRALRPRRDRRPPRGRTMHPRGTRMTPRGGPA